MIKAAFFDIDGTLISHEDGTVPRDCRLCDGFCSRGRYSKCPAVFWNSVRQEKASGKIRGRNAFFMLHYS